MRKIPSLGFLFLALLLAAAFLASCGPAYYPGDHRYPDDRRYPEGAYGRYGNLSGDIRGTVESVNPRERLIYIAREGYGDRYNLRNGDSAGDYVLSYDDGTTVRYQGRTFWPEDLERGDRIQASVDRDDRGSGRLFAESIDVLYDVSQGGPPQRGYGDDDRAGDLRGTIRSIDTRAHTLEISDPDRDDRVVVRYDDNTAVRYQGRLYSPENLERGDEVRIRTHDYDGRLFAQEIVVTGDRRSGG